MKSIFGSAAIALTVFAFSPPVSAQIPVIAGDYISTTRVYCEPILAINHNSGAINSIISAKSAPTSYSIALEYFDPRTALMTATGWSAKGSSLLLNDSASGESGSPFAENPDSLILFYSNDATTVTIDRVLYQVTWGRLHNTQLYLDVPQYFSLVGIDSNGCLRQSDHVRR